ncbi:hypothetical protein B0H13DRAFT_2339833 [Mycena leptocephala]|nr:hypothetical protein B0H13DRAFT_2339833 [Mycena leptocephala]
MSNSSASALQCTGIAPNLDIAGIGVRVAIYAQALLSILPPTVFAWKGKFSSEEIKKMSRMLISIILTACALLLSTGIQAATSGISLYHALIILQLSWINSMTFVTVNFVAHRAENINTLRNALPLRGGQSNRNKASEKEKDVTEQLLLAICVASLHFIAVGVFGIYVWNKIQTFGNQPECNKDTFLVILSRTVYVTHGPIRRISLAIYGISVIPIFNIYLIGIPFIIVYLIGSITLPNVHSDANARLALYFAISVMATAMSILVANTEQMIHRSSGLVQPGEGNWTFGQTLALILLFFPIWAGAEKSSPFRDRKSDTAGPRQVDDPDSDSEVGALVTAVAL